MIINCTQPYIYDTVLAYMEFTQYSYNGFVYDNPMSFVIIVPDNMTDCICWLDWIMIMKCIIDLREPYTSIAVIDYSYLYKIGDVCIVVSDDYAIKECNRKWLLWSKLLHKIMFFWFFF